MVAVGTPLPTAALPTGAHQGPVMVGSCFHKKNFLLYRNDPKFSGRLIWANSADPDQTAPRGAV